jgi:hypothetical protein
MAFFRLESSAAGAKLDVQLRRKDGVFAGPLSDTRSSDYKESHRIRHIDFDDDYILEVDAAGAWKITLVQPKVADSYAEIKGLGIGLTPVFTVKKGEPLKMLLKHEGAGRFEVKPIDVSGGVPWFESVFSASGKIATEKLLTPAQDAQVIFVVEASGLWSFQLSK